MKVSYKREMNHNYLIMEPDDQGGLGYESKMLVSNCIEGLLKFRISQADGGQLFYYEITSRQPLSRLLENRYIKSGEIRQILIHVALTLNRVEEYLLKEEQILLKPEYIYIDPETFIPSLCMVPGYTSSFPDEFTRLLQFFLEKVDHKDQESVVLAYSLYHESLKENYGMKDLLAFLTEKKWRQQDKKAELYEERERKQETDWRAPYQEQEVRKEQIEIPVIKQKTVNLTGERRETQGRKETVTSLIYQIGIMLAAPFLLWFLKGTGGLQKYGAYLAAGEAVFLLVVIIHQVLSLKSVKRKVANKREDISESRWKITPEYVEEENISAENRRAVRKPETVFQNDIDNIEKGDTREEEETQMKTALLADFSENGQEKGAQAVFISLDESWGNIKILYTPFLVGKSEELADYRLNKSTVSRLHLRIDRSEDIYTVTDLNSTNGTSIGGRQLETNETVKVEDGDIIYIADLGFQFTRK